MFASTAQTREQQAAAAAADYHQARQRYTQLQAERARVLAAPLAAAEVVRVVKMTLARSRARFESELSDRLSILNDPTFDLTNAEHLDALDPIKVRNAHPSAAYSDALNAIFADEILRFVESVAKRDSGERGWTIEKKQRELARIDAAGAELDTAAQRALNLWRTATGRLREFPE